MAATSEEPTREDPNDRFPLLMEEEESCQSNDHVIDIRDLILTLPSLDGPQQDEDGQNVPMHPQALGIGQNTVQVYCLLQFLLSFAAVIPVMLSNMLSHMLFNRFLLHSVTLNMKDTMTQGVALLTLLHCTCVTDYWEAMHQAIAPSENVGKNNFTILFGVGNVCWLCIVFLTFSCIGYAMPFILCAMICCCLPCIISVLGVHEDMNGMRGASEESINALPTYKFKSKRNGSGISGDNETEVEEGGFLAEGTEKERVISGEDAPHLNVYTLTFSCKSFEVIHDSRLQNALMPWNEQDSVTSNKHPQYMSVYNEQLEFLASNLGRGFWISAILMEIYLEN
nr:E3 ubiquitin-protein ligase At1g63170-like [Ipomoea batatas]